jgi:hypothetical protein
MSLLQALMLVMLFQTGPPQLLQFRVRALLPLLHMYDPDEAVYLVQSTRIPLAIATHTVQQDILLPQARSDMRHCHGIQRARP